MVGHKIRKTTKEGMPRVGEGVSKMEGKAKKILQKGYIVLVLLFLYAPILVLAVLSFNKSKSRAKWGGFTFHWYQEMLKNEKILSALSTTLMIAFLSALLATVLGTLAAVSINRMKKLPKAIMMSVTNIPMLNSEIVTGISLMILYYTISFSLGFTSVLLALTAAHMPYVILNVLPKLRQTSRSTYEAALDLGASPLAAFFEIVLPDIFPGVLSGFMLAFTLALDDFVITHFTKNARVNTLSTVIYAETRRGIEPEIYALSTVMFTVVLILLIAINRTKARMAKKMEEKRD